jgi:hypothetical protein
MKKTLLASKCQRLSQIICFLFPLPLSPRLVCLSIPAASGWPAPRRIPDSRYHQPRTPSQLYRRHHYELAAWSRAGGRSCGCRRRWPRVAGGMVVGRSPPNLGAALGPASATAAAAPYRHLLTSLNLSNPTSPALEGSSETRQVT